tara:strand:- start:324 stop:737 length:414 start_codon:yes stop_codon:yes gene_type:complete
MVWIVGAYKWVKENLFLVGAAVGGLVSLIVAVLLNNRDDDSEIILEHNQDSNDARRERDRAIAERTERYTKELEAIRSEAQAAGERLEREQEEAFVERLDAFSNAKTDEQRREIAEDIQEQFPFLNRVDASVFGKVE